MSFQSAYLVAFIAAVVDATSIKFDYLPVGHARTDPIITKTCLSDHVHTFYGPQAVRPETDYDTLIQIPTEQNTGNVVENKSLYWHPTVYSYDRSSDTYTRDEIAQTSAYYIWENDIDTRAFPNGFQMIAGLNPNDPSQFPNAQAECVNASPCQRSDCSTENSFFPSEACEELEVSMSFPTCWDGRLDSDDHVSHVHYTLNGELDGPCPSSHPLRLPQIRLFFRIIPYNGGWHTFSDGSSIYHADYMSGWNETFLQDVLDNCETDSFAANPHSFCEEFLEFRDGPKCTDEDICDFADPMLLEKIKAFQPPPLDITSTVSGEETEIVVGGLPRGTCIGDLIPLNEIPWPPTTCATGDGWTDDSGATCSWYELNEPTGCPQWKWYPGSNGLTAGQACCHCQGNNNGGSCATGNGWTDNSGATCLWYETYESAGCPTWKNYPGPDGQTAGQACCHCQGGGSGGCATGNGWTDDFGTTCSWYETNEPAGCATWSWYPGPDGQTAGQACCHCQAGGSGGCATGNGWTDNSGATCSWYETYEPAGCATWSWYPGPDGQTAGQACCHCN